MNLMFMPRVMVKSILVLCVLVLTVSGTLNSVKPKTDEIVEIQKLVRTLPFENIDGGAWKQGWPIVLQQSDWLSDSSKPKLQVHVVPHSHNDPGWLKTFDDYFLSQTNGILSSVLTALRENERRHFIWAEISFFDKWWTANPDKHEQFREILKTGRFEFVTGGWVMNDEATSHYPSIIYQLTEGHEWLRKKFNYKPTSGWSIDPFGYSPTQAYLLSSSGFEFMLIQRVHYALKKHLAKNTQLEFVWRQQWTQTDATDIFTHLMPFYSYDIPHTCGPEPAVCSLYEFSKRNTAWGGTIVPINDNNVQHKSEALLDQYRKKSTLYRTKSVLAPLGDDFTYPDMGYVNDMFPNHQKIHDFLNSRPEYHVDIKFSNLSNYFYSVAKNAENSGLSFPVLTGDFFTYADRENDYWSGYYTSRAFFKGLDRAVESSLRTAEILHTFARLTRSQPLVDSDSSIFDRIQKCRQTLSLFQHHDGITGTSKPHVVVNYATMLHESRWEMKEISKALTKLLLTKSTSSHEFSVDEVKRSHDQVHEKEVLRVMPGKVRSVVLFNPLSFVRKQIASVVVDNIKVHVVDAEGNKVPCQLNPVWPTDSNIISNYELFFQVQLEPMSYTTYFIEYSENSWASIAEVIVQGAFPSKDFGGKQITVTSRATDDQLTISNDYVTLQFSSDDGVMTNYKSSFGESINMKEDLLEYVSNGGAYLFLPQGNAYSILRQKPLKLLRIVKGPLVEEIHTIRILASRIARVYKQADSIASAVEMTYDVDITELNKELVVRFSSNIQTNGEFSTDLNGLQYQQRKYRSERPIQQNYYPSTSTIWIQDSTQRFTVHTAQSMGVASLADGAVELMLDRKLGQDDNRGLGEPVRDNHPLRVKLVLLHEKSGSAPGTELSPLSTAASLQLNYPITAIYGSASSIAEWKLNHYTSVSYLSSTLPPSLHFVTLRPRDEATVTKEIIAQVLRIPYDPAFASDPNIIDVNMFKLFPLTQVQSIEERTLTLIHQKQMLSKESSISFTPRQISAFVISADPFSYDLVDTFLRSGDNVRNTPNNAGSTPVYNPPVVENTPENTPAPGPGNNNNNNNNPNVVPTDESIIDLRNKGNNKQQEEIELLEAQLRAIQQEKDALKRQLENEMSQSRNNRIIALMCVLVGFVAIFYFRKTKNVVIVFLMSAIVNVVVPLFLFLPDEGNSAVPRGK